MSQMIELKMIKLKLSNIMIAMREGGFISKKTGKVAVAQEKTILHNYHYVHIAWPKDAGSVIDVTPINCLAFMKEFVDMQNFTERDKAECGYVMDETVPAVLTRNSEGIARYTPKQYGGIFTLLGSVGMEEKCSEYVESRLAGMARAWGNANGYKVVEDFLVYHEKYA